MPSKVPVPARAPESSTPEGRLYRDPGVLSDELERFFYRNWVCVARDEDLASPGDFVTRAIGRENILLVRSDGGRVRGFYNLCRHRGTRVTIERSGAGARSFICPYHAWSYDRDGRLIGAPYMQQQAGFDRSEYGLHPIEVGTWGGFLWVRLQAGGADLTRAFEGFFRKFDRFPLAELRCKARQDYEVEANWKIVVENFSECYHCGPVHPSLSRITPPTSGHNDARFLDEGGRSRFAGGFMEFTRDYTSMTRTGYTGRPFLAGGRKEDRRRIYYYVLFPNTFFSLHPDYLMIHRVWPMSPTRSRIENEFYFAPEAFARPDFDPSDAVQLWDEINRQDWGVCELAQEGTGSRAWTGGRFSDREELVQDFDAFVTQPPERDAPSRSDRGGGGRATRRSPKRRRSE